MAAMFLLGGLARKGYDTRALVYLGYILIGIAQWELSTLDLTMSISNFVWPTMVQGIGMGLIFPTLAGAALSSVSRENMGYAASFFSMVRNIGASVGTSTLTTYLTHLEQTRQSYLVNHVTVFDAWQLGESGPRVPGAMRFDYMHQLITGQKQGLAMIYGEVQRQAMMLSLNDIYRALCYLMVVAVIITAFLPRSRVQGGAAAAH
jgi:DHA2 family multidrug resistance protein